MKYQISAISRKGKPYRVASVTELPTTAKDLHKLLQERVVERHGWSRYVISRCHWYGEKTGFKLVASLSITPEAISIIKTDPAHPVFPDFPMKKMWWEKESDIPRNMGIHTKPSYGSRNLQAFQARAGLVDRLPKMKTKHSGRAGLIAVLTRGRH